MANGKKLNTVKSYASTFAGVAKTFVKGTSGSNSEKDIDYGAGPKPPKGRGIPIPNDWYRSYGQSRREGKK